MSAIDLSGAAKTPTPKHNLAVVTVEREDTDPLVCPEMTAPQMIISPPRFQGGPPTVQVQVVLVACIGKHCAKWSPSKMGCGAAKF